MKFQEQVLAHMREKFPDVSFKPGPRASRPRFDPATDMDIAWDQEREEIGIELARYISLHQFCSGLEALTRQFGVIVAHGADDGTRTVSVRVATKEELSDGGYYRLDENEYIVWQRRMN